MFNLVIFCILKICYFRTDDTVKHMRICNTMNSNEQKYCLSQSKYFNTIEELVQNYQQYSLRENFERLKENTMLEWPYRQLIALVLEDFEPQDRSQLRLRAGDQIIIIGKEGYRDGWWKAKSKHGVSYKKIIVIFK